MSKVSSGLVVGLFGLVFLASCAPVVAQEREGRRYAAGGELERMRELRRRMADLREEVRGIVRDEGRLTERQQRRMGNATRRLADVMEEMGRLLARGDMNDFELRVLSNEMDELADMIRRWSERVRRGTR